MASLSEQVLARVRAAVGQGATVELYGSSVYAPAYADDVDVLVAHADAPSLADALGLTLIPTSPPRMSGVIDGTDVDITVVNGDDETARRMRAGPRDAALLAAQLRDHDRDAVFQAAWPHVRRFVQLRALGQNGLGWFGSFGWALLLAIPLVTDLREVAPGAALPAWFRWLGKLAYGTRVSFEGVRTGELDPIYLAAPAPPARDVARLTKRAASNLFAEARAAAGLLGQARTDAEALERISDIAHDRPEGTTLVIAGDDEQGRGRYDGVARGLIRDLEALCATRSWGRFDLVGDEGGWQHRITVATPRRHAASELIEHWLAIHNIDAVLL